MKSVKINSRGTPIVQMRSEKEFEKKQIQKKQGPKETDGVNRQQLGKLVKQIAEWIEKKGCKKLKVRQKVLLCEQESISSFREKIFELLEIFDQNKQKSGVSQKVIQIKTKQKVKLRLIKSSDRLNDYNTSSIDENNEKCKDKIIMDLQAANKNLEKRILLLGCEFKQLKDLYEAQITKYRSLLSNSLFQIQSELKYPSSQYQDSNFRNKTYSTQANLYCQLQKYQKKGLYSEKCSDFGQKLTKGSFKTLINHEKSDSKNTFGNISID